MKQLLPGLATLAAALAVSATPALAQGPYIRADVGYNGWAGGLDIDGPTAGPAGTALSGLDPDLEGNVSEHIGVGYDFNGFRLELEGGHRFNQLEPSGAFASGDVHVWSGMVNAFIDFNRKGRILPYIGGGLGYARLEANGVSSPIGTFQRFDDGENAFAFQGLAGVTYKLTERLALDVGYRYFNAQDADFQGFSGSTSFTNGTAADFDGDYRSHAVTGGLRLTFGGPSEPPPPPAPPPAPPPPPPAPPPLPPIAQELEPVAQACPTQEFKVYFAWDRSNLDDAAQQTIDAAVARARECNVAGVEVVGFTDTSGSPSYNLALSDRRAGVVRDAMVARGIPGQLIATEAAGENLLDRPTPDGVREPLNRRSAVTIRFAPPEPNA